MNDPTLKAVVEEIGPLLAGRVMGKLFQLSRTSVAIDFRPGDGRYLFISVEPAAPRIHMIERRVRDLEKQSQNPSPFLLSLRKQLSGATLRSLYKDTGDRVVRLSFDAQDDVGNTRPRTLVAQLTGRGANLFLLDERDRVMDALRAPRGTGQEVGETYQPPQQQAPAAATPGAIMERGRFGTLSEAVDDYYRRLEAERAFAARAAAARANLRKEIARREKLGRRLADDLTAHGDAAEHKRAGDLLLANIGTAEREGGVVRLRDYYADGAPMIEMPVDENLTLQEEAARRFARYAKAKRASEEIKSRLATLEAELEGLRAKQAELEETIVEGDAGELSSFVGGEPQPPEEKRRRRKPAEAVAGARRYRSSDGYEILVGRAAMDNDRLTFKVARPHDLWLHAADYPGSHVVVRNPTRAEVPHRTVVEAAQLAAAFSQARRDAKVDVHYTQRKFLSKPRGAAPGLVRMSSFRTITVEPREAGERQ